MNQMNLEALKKLQADLSVEDKGALGHLLNNHLQMVVFETGMIESVKNLISLVREIVDDKTTKKGSA